MRNLKTYSNETVTYNFVPRNRKWEFVYNDKDGLKNTFLADCDGATQAHKVANFIKGSLKRRGVLDGLAKSNISKALVVTFEKPEPFVKIPFKELVAQ